MAKIYPSYNSWKKDKTTLGERKLGYLLNSLLDDDYLVWFDVAQRNHRSSRYPDFIILHPKQGLLFLEVKDFKAPTIKSINNKIWEIATKAGVTSIYNPLEQARQASFHVLENLKKDKRLQQQTGDFKGNITFPYDYAVFLTNITSEQVDNWMNENERESLLPSNKFLFRDDLAMGISAEQLQTALKRMFTVHFPCNLTKEQMDIIRWHLFPEIRLDNFQQSLSLTSTTENNPQNATQTNPPAINNISQTIRIMDLQQEQIARNLGEGHRVIHGVAGSGKTIIMLYRCSFLAQFLKQPILVLCYNITLAARLRSYIVQRNLQEQVEVKHLHGWCQEQCQQYNLKNNASSNFYDGMIDAVAKAIENGTIPAGQYGAVMIDEGQDFKASWLKMTTKLVNLQTNYLLLLYDDAQSIYKKPGLNFSLASVGIKAQGRTIKMRLNYRNSTAIVSFAWNLVRKHIHENNDSDIPLIEPESANIAGENPAIRKLHSLQGEINLILRCLNKWHGKGVKWNEVAILYPTKETGDEITKALKDAQIPCNHLNNRDNKKNWNAHENILPIMSIHNSKGLEFPTVIIVDASNFSKKAFLEEAIKILYVGITRAQANLLITYHKENEMSQELVNAAKRENTNPN